MIRVHITLISFSRVLSEQQLLTFKIKQKSDHLPSIFYSISFFVITEVARALTDLANSVNIIPQQGELLRKSVSSECPALLSDKEFAVEGHQHSEKKFRAMVTKLIQAEESTKFQPNHKCEKSSAPHAGWKARRNSNLLTEDQKEARRYRRMLANRESARQTILRRQARCKELARKAAELECENENLKKEKEVAMRKYESLKSTNERLKAQLNLNRLTVNVEVEGTQEGSKFNNAHIPTSASTKTQQPHVYYQPSGLPYITAGSNIVQAAPQNGTVNTSKIPMITNSKTSLSEHGNPVRMNVPRSPYALPYTWLFPLPPYYATGVPHQLSDLANKHVVTNESSTHSFRKTVADVKNDQTCPPQIKRGEASTSTKITGPSVQMYCEKASGKKIAHKHKVASAAVTNSSSSVIGLNARQTEAINRRNEVIISAATTSTSAAEAQTDGNLLRRQMYAFTAAAARKRRKDAIKMKNFRYARQSHVKMS